MKTLTMLALALCPTLAAAEPLPREVAGLECLIGTWKGAGTLAMGKDTAKIDATWQCKRTSAQFGVLCTFHVTGIPGIAAYEETDLIGYEPNTNTYHWYAVTNAGETHDHVAKPTEGTAIEFVFTGQQAGKPLKEVIAFDVPKDGKSIAARAETFVGGTPTSVLDVKLKKA